MYMSSNKEKNVWTRRSLCRGTKLGIRKWIRSQGFYSLMAHLVLTCQIMSAYSGSLSPCAPHDLDYQTSSRHYEWQRVEASPRYRPCTKSENLNQDRASDLLKAIRPPRFIPFHFISTLTHLKALIIQVVNQRVPCRLAENAHERLWGMFYVTCSSLQVLYSLCPEQHYNL